MTWIVTLPKIEIMGPGMQSKHVVQRWNAKASKQDQIQGRKAQAIKNCLELLPTEDRLKLEACVRLSGWETSPFIEEALADKRIYPGQCKSQHHVKEWAKQIDNND